MSEIPILEVITPDQDAIWRKRLKGATDYSIQLQRLIESLKREDTPYPELHHHKMVIAVKERISRLESENTRLREALEKLRRSHYECEDGWYSCPKSDSGCFNDGEVDGCTCGADYTNGIIDAALAEKEQPK